MSGPRIGKRGKTKSKGNNHRTHDARLVKLHSNDELMKLAMSGTSGKDKLQAQNELVKRNHFNKEWNMPWIN